MHWHSRILPRRRDVVGVKIGLVRARYTPFGGAERFAQLAIEALDARGTQVSVIARRWVGAPASTSQVRFVRCDPFYIGSTWRDFSFAAAVRSYTVRAAFDLVQSHERIVGLDVYRAGDGVHAAWLERRAKASGAWQRFRLMLNPHHWYLKRVEKEMFEHRDLRAVICNSTMVRDEILQRFRIAPEKLRLIHNGVDLDRFDIAPALASREAVRTRLSIPADASVLVLVGSGFERKGVATAIEALAVADASVQLIVVGTDKHLERYRARARALGVSERVHFIGATTDPLPFFGAADAVILPSIYDPFPNAVLEGMACGLPAIVSDGCGARELIENGVNGWVCGVGDVAGFAAAINWVIEVRSDAHGRERARAAARESVGPYSLSALGRNLLAFYHDLLGNVS